MSISEISAASALPVRRRTRMSAMAASAFGLGALRIEATSSSERPLTTGTWGTTASGEAPRSRPSSSSQWRRPECTSVKGRRSSTLMTTRSGNSRTTSARRISGIAATRPAIARGSRRKRLVPGSTAAATRGRSALFAEDPDLGLERDPELVLHAVAREVHERQDVGRGRAASVHDKVRVLGGDLRAVDPLALEPALLDQPAGHVGRRILPDAPRRREGERLRGLLLLQADLDVLLDLGERSAREPQAAADEHGARGRVEGPVGEGARGRLEFAERAVRVEKVNCAHKIA